MSLPRIGFVGLGLMGRGMALNLLAKGWPLTVLAHRKRETIEELKTLGAAEAASAQALAEASDIVILCVTGSPQVEAVINGAEGLAAAGKPLTILDCSTSDPTQTRRLAETLAPRGITLLDAPLGRTPQAAVEGKLDVMIGGSAKQIEFVRPVLQAFAQHIVHTGPVGSGHSMKLINNFIGMGYAALYSEALVLAAKAGITAPVFDNVIRGGRLDSGFYQTFIRWTLERDPNAHPFALANALKDVSYLAAFANAEGVVNTMGAAVRNSFAAAKAAGHGDDHLPTLPDIIAKLNGLPPVSLQVSLPGKRQDE